MCYFLSSSYTGLKVLIDKAFRVFNCKVCEKFGGCILVKDWLYEIIMIVGSKEEFDLMVSELVNKFGDEIETEEIITEWQKQVFNL